MSSFSPLAILFATWIPAPSDGPPPNDIDSVCGDCSSNASGFCLPPDCAYLSVYPSTILFRALIGAITEPVTFSADEPHAAVATVGSPEATQPTDTIRPSVTTSSVMKP